MWHESHDYSTLCEATFCLLITSMYVLQKHRFYKYYTTVIQLTESMLYILVVLYSIKGETSLVSGFY